MKRSEAVLAIMECLVEPHSEDVEKEADYILKKLEKFGMLPPEIEGVYSNIPTVTPTGHLDYSYKRGWEPEDETRK